MHVWCASVSKLQNHQHTSHQPPRLYTPPPPPTPLAFKEPCFLTFTFNPIHYCGPPSKHSAVRGDKSPAKYGCVFVPLDLCCPPMGILHPFLTSFSPCSDIYSHPPPPPWFSEGQKIPGAVHCVTSSMGGNAIQRGWNRMQSQQRAYSFQGHANWMQKCRWTQSKKEDLKEHINYWLMNMGFKGAQKSSVMMGGLIFHKC